MCTTLKAPGLKIVCEQPCKPVALPRSPRLRKFTFRSADISNSPLGLRDWFADRLPGPALCIRVGDGAHFSKAVSVDIIGGDEIDSPELHTTPNLRFLNFRGSQNREP
jgi:hypothetical protein